MAKPNYTLIIGGVVSTLLSAFHIVLAMKPELYRYIDPGQGTGLGQMAEQGSSLIIILTLILALIFAIWALYAFSGARLIRPFPLLGAALIVISVIYLLRGLFLGSEIKMVMNEGYPFRFVVFSSISLLAGVLYLIGYLKLRRLRLR